MDYSRRLDERSYEELIELLTKVIQKGDGNVYTYISGVLVSCNGEETPAGQILRLADVVLEGDGVLDDENIIMDGPPVQRIKYSDLLLDAEEEKMTLKNRTPRFQLFATELHFDKHRKYRPYFLSGHVTVFNHFVKAAASEDEVVWLPADDLDLSLPAYGDGGWIPLDDPDYGVSLLFYRPFDDPIHILNTRLLEPLTHPTHSSIPVYNTFLDIIGILYAIGRDPDDEDDVYKMLRDLFCHASKVLSEGLFACFFIS